MLFAWASRWASGSRPNRHSINFKIELTLFSHTGQRIAGGSMLGALVGMLAGMCHVLPPALWDRRKAGGRPVAGLPPPLSRL